MLTNKKIVFNEETDVSLSPSGELYTLPAASDYPQEYARLEKLAAERRSLGHEIVVVMGLGFVGAVMAAVIANAEFPDVERQTSNVQPPTSNSSPSNVSRLTSNAFSSNVKRPTSNAFSSNVQPQTSSNPSNLKINSFKNSLEIENLKLKIGPESNTSNVSRPTSKFVIGIQRPSPRSYWKIEMLNRGKSPFKTEDPKVQQYISSGVLEKKNLVATYTEEALKLADVVVVDIQCDYHKNEFGNVENGYVDVDDLKEALHTIGRYISPKTLVLIETTVPPGTTEYIAYPIIKEEFAKRGIGISDHQSIVETRHAVSGEGNTRSSKLEARNSPQGGVGTRSSKLEARNCSEPLLAHSYERVMPGRNYVDSIQNFWRVCSGINSESRDRVVKFLNEVLNTKDYPLTVMDRPIESETAKIMENSYRAALLAFADEWSLFAEQNGVDITKVIKAIKVRPTHSNIMFPGPGIGGYCLPKDGALGAWAYQNLLGGKENILKISTQAININDTRPLHAVDLLLEAIEENSLEIENLKLKIGSEFPSNVQPQTSSNPSNFKINSLKNSLEIENLKLKIGSESPSNLSGLTVAVLGASYREDVGDTRYSGSEIIVRKLTELGATVRIHDPYVETWPELQSNNGRSVFFKNQQNIDSEVSHDLGKTLQGVDAIILAVRHKQYLELSPGEVVNEVNTSNVKRKTSNEFSSNSKLETRNSPEGGVGTRSSKLETRNLIILDCFSILSDEQIKRYLELGCKVKGLGRGHIKRMIQY